MPLLDVKAIMLRAAKSRRKAQEKVTADRRKKPTNEKPEPVKKKSKKKRPPRQKKETEQLVCRRAGCYNTGPFPLGFCTACYDSLRYAPRETPCSPLIPVEQHFAIGDFVLVSGAHRNKDYRGLYATILLLENERTIAIVRFTGESINRLSRKQRRKIEGLEVHIIVEQLLAVEE